MADVFTLESHAAREYWTLFFRKLGEEGVSRRSDHPINSALDATSHFLSGLTLRWVLFHGLSPAHGYLHTQTGYLALVYDLMELFRWWSEKAVFDAVEAGGLDDLTARSIERLKDALAEAVHTEPTRQNVYRKTLIHGAVISLRHYLTGSMRFFLPPVEESPKQRGRKRNVSYTLPGQIWEK